MKFSRGHMQEEKLSESNAPESHAARGHLTGARCSGFICTCPSSHPFFACAYSVCLPLAGVLITLQKRSLGTRQVCTARRGASPRGILRSEGRERAVRAQPGCRRQPGGGPLFQSTYRIKRSSSLRYKVSLSLGDFKPKLFQPVCAPDLSSLPQALSRGPASPTDALSAK